MPRDSSRRPIPKVPDPRSAGRFRALVPQGNGGLLTVSAGVTDLSNFVFTLVGKDARAHGQESAAGFTVKAGSTATKRLSRAFERTGNLVKIRAGLIADGALRDNGAVLGFVTDVIFKSPSAAASIVLGNPANGLAFWRLEDGTSLKKLRARSST
jgi:Domain of unknown function (DUF4357)